MEEVFLAIVYTALRSGGTLHGRYEILYADRETVQRPSIMSRGKLPVCNFRGSKSRFVITGCVYPQYWVVLFGPFESFRYDSRTSQSAFSKKGPRLEHTHWHHMRSDHPDARASSAQIGFDEQGAVFA